MANGTRPEIGGGLLEGAAEAAPTAPHATPRVRDRDRRVMASGPERFWSTRRTRVAFGVMLAASLGAHYALSPWTLFPDGFEIRDVEGDIGIPIDVLEGEAAEPPPPPPPAPPDPPGEAAKEPQTVPAPAVVRVDAGRPDAGPRDAGSPDADAAVDAASDGGPIDAGGDAPDEGGALDGGALAALADAGADAGGAATGPRDPTGVLGAVGAAQADVVLVMLVVNAEVIRKNPVGARLGPLLRGIPQWDEFMSGTPIDPVRDTDWVTISGPSLVNTQRDVVLIHYSTTDALVEKAVEIVSKKYDKGGPYDAGVPGVKAWLGHADRGERVFLRPPQSRVLAVVPPVAAQKVATTLKSAKVPDHVLGGKEAMRLRLSNPHRPIPDIPESVTELRLWIVPRADEGADIFAEGDCATEAAATDAAQALTKLIARRNTLAVRFATNNLLGNVDVETEGARVKVHITASRDQLEAVLGLVAGFLNVDLSKPAVPTPTPQGTAPTAGNPKGN